MSWQKCVSFSKCSNLKAKNVIHLKRCHKKDKKSDYKLRSTKSPKPSFLDGFYASGNKI